MLALARAATASCDRRSRRSCSRRWCSRCCVAPLLIQFAEPIVRRLTANDWLARAAQVTQIASHDDGAAGPRDRSAATAAAGRISRACSRRGDPVRRARHRPGARARGGGRRRVASSTATRAGARRWSRRPRARRARSSITFADTPTALKILHHVHAAAAGAAGDRAHASTTASSTRCSRPARRRSSPRCSRAA